MTARHPLGGLGVLLATIVLGLVAGPFGIVAGLLTAALWAFVPAAYAFAAGQVLAVAVLPAAPLGPEALVIEVGLFAVLAGSLVTVDAPVETLVAFAVAAIGLAAVPITITASGRPLWQAALVLTVLAAAIAYGLHRYERVVLGLVEEVA